MSASDRPACCLTRGSHPGPEKGPRLGKSAEGPVRASDKIKEIEDLTLGSVGSWLETNFCGVKDGGPNSHAVDGRSVENDCFPAELGPYLSWTSSIPSWSVPSSNGQP